MSDLRYPIGKFEPYKTLTEEKQNELISDIEKMPDLLRKAVSGLSESQLDTNYRPDGWTVRQVVHHLFDSHQNAYTRFKLTMTEHEPTIKPYDETAWAELVDAKTAPVDISLMLLDNLHKRWVMYMKSLKLEDFSKNYTHPDHGKVNLVWGLSMYSWHSRHHVAHITELRKRMSW